MKKNIESDKAKSWYLSNFESFEKKLNGESSSVIHKFRKEAVTKLKNVEFPTQKHEEWKYTNLTPILTKEFTPSFLLKNQKLSFGELEEKLLLESESNRLVFVNGIYDRELSLIKSLPSGAIISNLSDVAEKYPEILSDKFGKSEGTTNAFTTLNSVYSIDGAVIVLPAGIQIENPIEILFLKHS